MTQRQNVYRRPCMSIEDFGKPAANGHRFGPELICAGEHGCGATWSEYQDAPDFFNHHDRLADQAVSDLESGKSLSGKSGKERTEAA